MTVRVVGGGRTRSWRWGYGGRAGAGVGVGGGEVSVVFEKVGFARLIGKERVIAVREDEASERRASKRGGASFARLDAPLEPLFTLLDPSPSLFFALAALRALIDPSSSA